MTMMTTNHNNGEDDDEDVGEHDHDVNGDDDVDYLAMITEESPGSSTAKSRMKSKGSMNCLQHR